MEKKNYNFLKNTIILSISGMVTKLMGLLIKIIYTRMVSTKTISIYSLVIPTYMLILNIGSFCMPTTICKLISEKKDKRILSNALLIIVIINFLLIIGMLFLAKPIAINLLKERACYPLLIATSLTLPLASIACILKGYFYGIGKMFPHVLSNTIEQIIRLILILTVLPKLIKISYIHAAIGIILTSIFTEGASIIVFLLCMKKNEVINLTDKKYYKDIYNLSMPQLLSKLIGSISYFLEPIILTYMLLKTNFSKDYIQIEYGIYTAYCISTLAMPSFFITAISQALLPELIKYKNNKKEYNKKIKQAFIFTFFLGLIFTSIISIFSDEILKLLYNTSKGSNYIKILSPFFILFYFENLFQTILLSQGKSRITFKICITSSIIKNISIITLSYLNLGIYSLIYSEIIDIIIIIILNIKYLKQKKAPL